MLSIAPGTMGGGASTAKAPEPPKETNSPRVTFSNAALQRRRARKKQRQKAYEYALVQHFDATKTGALNREEVKALTGHILKSTAGDAAIVVSDEDIDEIMKIGGSNCKAEITLRDIPMALSVIEAINEKNAEVGELFKKYDTDASGALPYAQLKPLLAEINEGEEPTEADLQYVLKQAEAGAEVGIGKTEIKSAIACWYCLCDEGRDEV